MIVRRTLLVVALLVIGTAPAVAAPAAGVSAGTKSFSTQCSTAFFDGDSRLGPEELADRGEIGFILHGYRRLAGMTPDRFLATFWDPAANNGQGGWRYPPDSGFLIVDGQPAEGPATLTAGERIDRFGSEYGAFLAPAGTRYARRSIPPQSLDTFDQSVTCNYHAYEILKPFTVESGPIAPAFGQPGHGVQYQIVGQLLPSGPTSANVLWLITNGYLKRTS